MSEKGSNRKLSERAKVATRRLAKTYGSPRHGNYSDPLDELIFIILSQMTTGPSFERVFERLKAECGEWGYLADIRLPTLKKIIKDAGLSNQKAPRLREIARRLRTEFGAVTLVPVAELPNDEAQTFLTSLPGIGVKSAKCVMMYSLGRAVLPVDTHVWRLSKRLGLVDPTLPYSRVHDALEAVVAPANRYDLHVNASSHGREVCKALRPRCSTGVLADICPSRST